MVWVFIQGSKSLCVDDDHIHFDSFSVYYFQRDTLDPNAFGAGIDCGSNFESFLPV